MNAEVKPLITLAVEIHKILTMKSSITRHVPAPLGNTACDRENMLAFNPKPLFDLAVRRERLLRAIARKS